MAMAATVWWSISAGNTPVLCPSYVTLGSALNRELNAEKETGCFLEHYKLYRESASVIRGHRLLARFRNQRRPRRRIFHRQTETPNFVVGIKRARYCASRGNAPDLTDAFRSIAANFIRHFDQDHVNLRCLFGPRNSKVAQKQRIRHAFRRRKAFGKRITQAHVDPAFHL